MTDVAEVIRTNLVQTSAIAAAVSTRIYPQHSPQAAALPRVIYQIVSGSTDHHLGGVSGLEMSRFQFDVEATTPSAARATAKLIRSQLETLQKVTKAGLWLDAVELGGVSDDSYQTAEGSDEYTYIARFDAEVWWQ